MASGWTIARWDSRTHGGIVERIIGTAMQMIHDEPPGTTFSNPDQRGDYDSENKAALTLRELGALAHIMVGTYHGSVHNGLLQPPAAGPRPWRVSAYLPSSHALLRSWSIFCRSSGAR
ncbi:hypothetical protein [Citrobacter freundii]